MKLQPLNDYIACVEVKKEEKVGLLHIPESAQVSVKYRRAKVVGVGAGRVSISGERIPPSVKVGDIIVFMKDAGLKLEFPEQHYILIGEDSVLARVEK